MINRMQEIKKKGFSMKPASNAYVPVDFDKIKVGIRSLSDAVLTLGDLKKVNSQLTDKESILRAINDMDLPKMREISNFFYRTSGIYNRLCRYFAYMYKYDWMVTPYLGATKVSDEKLVDSFNAVLKYLDDSYLKKFFGEVALKIAKNGCYYGYIVPSKERLIMQELPPAYCRSRFTDAYGRPVVEFNMKFFDDSFKDVIQRMKMLKLFPDEFRKGYAAYKDGKLIPDFPGDTAGWYLLTTTSVVKFNMNGDDFPAFMAVIPAIVDLDAAQDLDRKKMEQELLKIIIQKMPIDNNGDLVFDVDEAQALHNNAVRMLGRAVGIDVLTTFAETEVADMGSNASNNAKNDSMSRVKSSVFDQAGVSQLQFNSDKNIALQNSILNDEASMANLMQQFEQFINLIITPFNKNPKKFYFRAQMLNTTIYNYKEMSKLYKEQTQLGYSKMLPQIALGQAQSSVLANAYFENDVLDLVNVFIPPMSSNTMSADSLAQMGDKENAGRPEKEESEKSDKTLANKESQS